MYFYQFEYEQYLPLLNDLSFDYFVSVETFCLCLVCLYTVNALFCTTTGILYDHWHCPPDVHLIEMYINKVMSIVFNETLYIYGIGV